MPKLCPVCGTSYDDANVFCPADGSTPRAAESESDLIGTVIAEGAVYLAMEYVPGRTLRKLLAAEGALPAARAIVIVRQVAEALDAAHRQGLVHRDLTPDNIMVVEDPALGDRCKVVDFGIAKAVGGGSEPGLTRTGFVVGTPEFMSPEQLYGSDVDHRSDVYALGLVAFQTLTGTMPFDTTTPERTMTARLTESPRPLAAVRPDVTWPGAVQAVFDQALARERDARYPSAGAPLGLIAGGALAGGAVGAVLFLRSDGGEADPGATVAPPTVVATEPPASGTALPPVDNGDSLTTGIPEPSATPASASGAAVPPAASPAGGTSVASGTRPVEARPAAPARPAPAGASPEAARFSLDSIREALDPATASAADARRAVAALRELLPWLATAEDSAWAFLRQSEAHFLMDDARSACLALDAARPLVRSGGQRGVLSLLSGGC